MSALSRILKMTIRKFNDRALSRKRKKKDNKRTGKLLKSKLITKDEAVKKVQENDVFNSPTIADKFKTKPRGK